MKTAVKPDLQSKTFLNNKSFILLREKETSVVSYKFYQKIFVAIISLSTILIFPESPSELGNICDNYNSIKLCNVW